MNILILLFKTFNDKLIKTFSNENNIFQKHVLKIMSSKTITSNEEKTNDVIYYNNKNENIKIKKNRMNTDNDAKIIFLNNSEDEKEINIK